MIDMEALAQKVDLSGLTRAEFIEIRLLAEEHIRRQIADLLREVLGIETRKCLGCPNTIRIGSGRKKGSKNQQAVYCSTACRQAAYRERRALRDGFR